MDIPSLEGIGLVGVGNETKALKPPVNGNAPWEGRDDSFFNEKTEKMVKEWEALSVQCIGTSVGEVN